MRLISCTFALALSLSGARAQSFIAPDSVTRDWAFRHLIGGIDSPAPGFAQTFACVKSWPEVTEALIAIYRDSASGGLARDDAILVLGATGQDSAFEFLVHTLDRMSAADHDREELLMALGNSADPPAFVYDRLAVALSSTIPGDVYYAAMALGDIGSSRSRDILQKARALATSKAGMLAIDRNFARFTKRKPRVVVPCDSAKLGPH